MGDGGVIVLQVRLSRVFFLCRGNLAEHDSGNGNPPNAKPTTTAFDLDNLGNKGR